MSSAARPFSAAQVLSATTAMPPHGWNMYGGFGAGMADDAFDAGNLERPRGVVAQHLAADDRGSGDDRDQHAGQLHVGAEDGAPVDEGGAVEERQRRRRDVASAASSGRSTISAALGTGSFAAAGTSAPNPSVRLLGRWTTSCDPRRARLGLHLPLPRSCGDEHHAGGGARLAQVLVELADARGAVGVLIAVLLVADRLAHDDACEVGPELVGDQDRDRAADALPHLRARAHRSSSVPSPAMWTSTFGFRPSADSLDRRPTRACGPGSGTTAGLVRPGRRAERCRAPGRRRTARGRRETTAG